MTLSDRELATVLFALRKVERMMNSAAWGEKEQQELRESELHFTDHAPLTVEEIDDLCDRLNEKDGEVTVYLLSEHEPDNSEFPYVVVGVYASVEHAERAKAAKQVERYGTSDDPEGYDFHEADIWWEIDPYFVLADQADTPAPRRAGVLLADSAETPSPARAGGGGDQAEAARLPVRLARQAVADTQAAVEHLRLARNLLTKAAAQRAVAKVRLAMKSAEGAVRHAEGKEVSLR